MIVSDAAIPRGTNLVTRAFAGQRASRRQPGQPVNRIADLNPNDIENVEVLKGAAASAIYGSKASNGVIMITTKRGRVGAPQFTDPAGRRVPSGSATSTGPAASTTRRKRSAAFGPAPRPTSTAPADVSTISRTSSTAHALSNETSVSVSGGTETTSISPRCWSSMTAVSQPRTYADKQGLRLNLDQNIGSRLQVALSGDIFTPANDRA